MSRKYKVKPRNTNFKFDNSKLPQIVAKVRKIRAYRADNSKPRSQVDSWLDQNNASMTALPTGYAIWEWQDSSNGGHWVLIENSCSGTTPPPPPDILDDEMPEGLQILVECQYSQSTRTHKLEQLEQVTSGGVQNCFELRLLDHNPATTITSSTGLHFYLIKRGPLLLFRS